MIHAGRDKDRGSGNPCTKTFGNLIFHDIERRVLGCVLPLQKGYLYPSPEKV